MKAKNDGPVLVLTTKDRDLLPVPTVLGRFHSSGRTDVYLKTSEGWRRASEAAEAPSMDLTDMFGSTLPLWTVLTPWAGASLDVVRSTAAIEAAAQLGWSPFGTFGFGHPESLEFAGTGEDGLPIWERIHQDVDEQLVIQIAAALLSGITEKILKSIPDGVSPEDASMSASQFLKLVNLELGDVEE